MPSVLAVIPARAGSKRLPGKNLKQIAGHSLIGWAVTAAKAARLVDHVVVSSDSDEMLAEGIRYGALPQKRPASLSQGENGSMDRTLTYVMEQCRWFHELVVLLQPTVPGRRPGLVDECVERLIESDADCSFSGRELHFVWKRRTAHNGNGAGREYHQTNCHGRRINRQDFVPADERWEEDGAVFVCRAELLRDTGSRIGGRVVIVPNSMVVDIDTAADFAAAEAQQRRQAGPPQLVMLDQRRLM